MSDQKYHQALTANRKLLDENARLQAQVERLTKAGDAMADEFNFIGSSNGGFNSIEQWNAAKEGKV
jgi:cell division septum initiation protein DivIVA